MTSRFAAASALERLQQVGAQVIGGVLNRVETKRHRYYYAPYYRADYAAYYGEGINITSEQRSDRPA